MAGPVDTAAGLRPTAALAAIAEALLHGGAESRTSALEVLADAVGAERVYALEAFGPTTRVLSAGGADPVSHEALTSALAGLEAGPPRWLDVDGVELIAAVRHGPDGSRLAVAAAGPHRDAWVCDALDATAAMVASAGAGPRAEDADARTTARRLETLISSLSAGILVEDEDGRIVVVNHELLRLFGHAADPSRLVGTDAFAATERAAAMFREPVTFLWGIESAIVSRRLRIGEELQTVHGRTLERDFVPILLDDEYRGHLWLYRDVTSRKNDEHRRERLLVGEREARARLERQNQDLERLDRLKSELVATVSHELGTPLTSIVSLAGLLADPSGGALDDEQREFVSVIERNANRLLRIVDDLLLIARFEAGRMELIPETLRVADLVSDAALALGPAADAAGVGLDAHAAGGAPLIGDRARIAQMLDNLVTNSIKFTPSGGKVRLRARHAPGWWTFTVSDTGVGIPDEDVPQVFQRFFRAHDARGVPGMGLGLSVVGAIVDAHGGRVALASTSGAGTVVTVDLPEAGPEVAA